MQGGKGFPKYFWYGEEGEYNILVIELMGYSLEALHTQCNKKFTWCTVLFLLDQMVFTE
jgi:hypothetical protein